MTVAMRPAASACPACSAAPAAEALADAAQPSDVNIVLSLPSIHCAACISGVEGLLGATDGVRGARVNLTLKRAQIDAAPGTTAQDLIKVLENAGFEAHELDSTALRATETDKAGRDLLMRLAVSGFAAMNIMLLSVAVWSGADGPTRDMFHWISAAIALPTIAFSAQPFFKHAWTALRAGRLNMDVPISLAILLALGTSLWETSLSGEHAYFDAAITLTFFLLAGRYLDHRTRAAARSAAEELAALEVPRVSRVTDTSDGAAEEQVPASELAIGDLIRVRPGGRMPVDGDIVDGQSELDRSLLTGETRPIYAGPGATVSAGEVNLTGPLTIRASAVGRDTSLHRMADLVAVALHVARRQGGETLCAGGSYPVRARLCGVVCLHARPAHRAQHRGGSADHHMSLRLGAGRAGGDHRGLGPAVPQRVAHQGIDGARTHGTGRHRGVRQDRDTDRRGAAGRQSERPRAPRTGHRAGIGRRLVASAVAIAGSRHPGGRDRPRRSDRHH